MPVDMESKKLPSCWTCKRPVRSGVLVLTTEGETLSSKEMGPHYKVAVWRYTHNTEECLSPIRNRELDGRLPLTFVAWIQMTLRLLQQKGSWFLFELTNWEYVLDCAQEDYVQGLNEYKNPEPNIAPRNDPTPALKKVRRRPAPVAKKKIIRKRNG